MKKFLTPVLLFIPLAALQLSVIPMISFKGIFPDLILILVVYYSVKEGQIFGMFLGFLLGFLFDLISGSLIGSSMFAKTLAGFIGGYFFKENDTFNLYSFNFFFITLLTASVASFVFALISYSNIFTNFLSLFFLQGLFPGFYTSIFTLPVIVFKPTTAIE